MKRRFTYRLALASHVGFDADFQNDQSCITISNLKTFGTKEIGNADYYRNAILTRYNPMYSKLDMYSKSGRKQLTSILEDEIKKKMDGIEELKLVIQMCRKDKVVLIHKQK